MSAFIPTVNDLSDLNPQIAGQVAAVWLSLPALSDLASQLTSGTWERRQELEKAGLVTLPFEENVRMLAFDFNKKGYKGDDASKVKLFSLGSFSWGNKSDLMLEFARQIAPVHREVLFRTGGGRIHDFNLLQTHTVHEYRCPENPNSMEMHFDGTWNTILLGDLTGLWVVINGKRVSVKNRPGFGLCIFGSQSPWAIMHGVEGPWEGLRRNVVSFHGRLFGCPGLSRGLFRGALRAGILKRMNPPPSRG